MKVYLFLLLNLVFFISCDNSKDKSVSELTEEDFKNYLIHFNPTQKNAVTNEDFKFGKTSFEITSDKIKENSYSIAANDYWALFLAQVSLQEPIEYTRYTFNKAYSLKPEIICLALQIQKSEFEEGYNKIINLLPEVRSIVNTCQPKELGVKDDTNVVYYSKQNNLNFELVSFIHQINETDQKFRENLNSYKVNRIKQDSIDIVNQKKIDSLYNLYKGYIGKSYVGAKYDHVMWLVIQHSNLDNMKKYFPVLQEAYKNGDLPKDAYKAFVDRMYHFEHGFQIFGSQSGVEIASDSIRDKILNEIGF